MAWKELFLGGSVGGSTEMVRDVLVVLPGILGRTLRTKDRAGENGPLVRAPSAGAVLGAIKSFSRSLKDLELSEGIGDENPGDGVEPVDAMPDLHVLPGIWSPNIGYGKLLGRMGSRFHLIEDPPSNLDRIPNLLPVAYDWRLSNRYNGRRLKRLVEPALERWQSQSGQAFVPTGASQLRNSSKVP